MNGGDVIARGVREQGVKCVFTLCGGHISPILVALKNLGIRIIDVRHEATAVFAADAMSRLTGIPGVAVVTAGPGVTNTVTAVENAFMAQSPLVILGGASATVLKGRGSLQDIDQLSLLKSVTKKTLTFKKNCDIVPVIQHAFSLAQSGVPGPVFVECPVDLLYDEDTVRKLYGTKGASGGQNGIRERVLAWYLRRHVDRMFSCDPEAAQPHAVSVPVPGMRRSLVRKAADALQRAGQPVLVIGSQAMLFPSKTDLLARCVERMNMPVYLTGMARGLLGREHPLHLRHRRREALRDSDLVILAGMPCDFRLNYGRDIRAGAKLISVNRSRRDLNLNRRPDPGIHSDPFLFLCALSEELAGRDMRWNAWLETLHGRDEEREREIERMAGTESSPVNPLALLKCIDSLAGENAVFVADGGDFVSTASYLVHPRRPLSWLDPGVFGTLGCGAGFALGTKLARPDVEVWVLFGDGAFGYSLSEFDTFARHNIPVIAVVGNDAAWSQITRDQVEFLHDDVGTVLARSGYHAAAAGLGAAGLEIQRPGSIDEVLLEARRTAAAGHPVVINAWIGITEFRKGSISM